MSVNTRIAIRLSEELRLQLEKEASANNLTLSRLIRSKLGAKKIYKPVLQISHNKKISFEELAKAKVVYEDVLV